MQFRQSSPPPYLNRSDQVRMLRMVGVLVLVLICMKFAASPGLWAWMFPKSSPTAGPNDPPAKKDIDYGVKFDEESPLAPDAFRSERQESHPQAAHQPAVAESSPHRTSEQPVERPPTKVGDVDNLEIDPDLLAPVSDGWLGIRKHEAPAFFAIIAKAKELPLQRLEKAGDNRVDYTVLMTDSEQFRGRLLTVEGTVRVIETVSISERDIPQNHGVDGYYVAWMWTASSGASPYRLIAARLPEDMPQGKNLNVPAKFTGYFFKKEGYRTEQGFHVAPVLIGQQIRWNRPAAEVSGTPSGMGLAPYIAGFVALIAFGVGLMIWRFHISDKKFGHKHIQHFTAASPSALQELASLETHDPSEQFRQMEAEEREAEKPIDG